MLTARDFDSMSRRDLKEALRAGHPIDMAKLDDTEYRGVSLGLPGFVDKLAWKTFKKVFHRDPESGHLRGWNVRMEQTGIGGEQIPMTKGGEPVTFGHYRVVEAAGRPLPGWCKPCERALLIDYSLGGNPAFDFISNMRDPLVAIHEGSVDLLLGWSYMHLGALQLGTPSFFTLERDCALTHRAPPPRPPPS